MMNLNNFRINGLSSKLCPEVSKQRLNCNQWVTGKKLKEKMSENSKVIVVLHIEIL